MNYFKKNYKIIKKKIIDIYFDRRFDVKIFILMKTNNLVNKFFNFYFYYLFSIKIFKIL